MTKAQALKQARRLRAEGKTVKVFEHAAVYTQPGRGLAVAISYEVRVIA
jgi:hypothetical protein